MTSHLASISHRQVTGRWMDLAFLVALLAFAVIGGGSVAMAINAAGVASSAQGAPLVESARSVAQR